MYVFLVNNHVRGVLTACGTQGVKTVLVSRAKSFISLPPPYPSILKHTKWALNPAPSWKGEQAKQEPCSKKPSVQREESNCAATSIDLGLAPASPRQRDGLDANRRTSDGKVSVYIHTKFMCV